MSVLADPAAPVAAGDDALARLVRRRRPGLSLDAAFYSSPEVHDLDVRAVFGRQWIFVASEPEIPEPGDYLTVEVGPWSVIVVRDDDEEVRAWHNVCRHRGARILTESAGSVGNIVCGYHRWTYGVDGRLLHAGPQPPSFDASCFGLRPVHVRVVAGLVYLCLADEPPVDVEDHAARVTPYLAPHRLGRTRSPTRRTSWRAATGSW